MSSLKAVTTPPTSWPGSNAIAPTWRIQRKSAKVNAPALSQHQPHHDQQRDHQDRHGQRSHQDDDGQGIGKRIVTKQTGDMPRFFVG